MGPASATYKKADNKTEAKAQNQVFVCILSAHSCVSLFCLLLFLVFFASVLLCFRFLVTKARKVEFKNACIFGLAFVGGERPLALRGPRRM